MDSLSLAQRLIRCPSVTPAQAGTLDVLSEVLTGLGFTCTRYPFGEVDNLHAKWGSGAPHLAFAGHVDVVPEGDSAGWSHPPYAANVQNDILYGRGVVDMKGAIAAFIAALAHVLPLKQGSISLLITADEEGEAVNGTAPLLKALHDYGERFDACLVGEPTSVERVGDTIKNGRRGSLTGDLLVRGKQGHVAYPDLADNPVPKLIKLASVLTALKLDNGLPDFLPSNLEVVNLEVGNPTANVIPAKASALFNVRFNPSYTSASLKQKIVEALDAVGLSYELNWRRPNEPFLCPAGPLVQAVMAAVNEVTGAAPTLSTSGGTSDARFIANYCPVVELGLRNASAHKVDEQAPVADLLTLEQIYAAALKRGFGLL
jgi:succinyl-diaminopimelate desuccinylase